MPETASPTRFASARSPLHSGIRVPMVLSLQIVATLFPLFAGFALYGWRAMGTTAIVLVSALGAIVALRRVGWRGRQIRMWHGVWLAILVALMLPAHLFTRQTVNGQLVWPILPAAGITVAL